MTQVDYVAAVGAGGLNVRQGESNTHMHAQIERKKNKENHHVANSFFFVISNFNKFVNKLYPH